jgi:hypothetical protein
MSCLMLSTAAHDLPVALAGAQAVVDGRQPCVLVGSALHDPQDVEGG